MTLSGLFLRFVLVSQTFWLGFSEEPGCTSKFDYDYKMLQKMVELEQRLKALDEKLNHQEKLIKKMSTDGMLAIIKHIYSMFIHLVI